MIRGPDGIRQHVIFIPGRARPCTMEKLRLALDEIEAWIQSTFEPNAYIYRRYASTSSLFLFDLNNAFAVKLRWHSIIVME